jgi:hypothetical protein
LVEAAQRGERIARAIGAQKDFGDFGRASVDLQYEVRSAIRKYEQK